MASNKVAEWEVASVDNSGNIECDGAITAGGRVTCEEIYTSKVISDQLNGDYLDLEWNIVLNGAAVDTYKTLNYISGASAAVTMAADSATGRVVSVFFTGIGQTVTLSSGSTSEGTLITSTTATDVVTMTLYSGLVWMVTSTNGSPAITTP